LTSVIFGIIIKGILFYLVGLHGKEGLDLEAVTSILAELEDYLNREALTLTQLLTDRAAPIT